MNDLYKKYGSFVVLAIILVLSYLVVRPLLMLLISTAIIAYIFFPVYSFINNKLKRKSLSSFISIILVGLILVLPILFIINNLVREIPSVYNWASGAVQNSKLWHDFLYDKISSDFGINIEIGKLIESSSSNLLKSLQGVLASVPNRIFNFLLSALFLFFFFRDGPEFVKRFAYFLPYGKKNNLIIMRGLKETMDGVIFGQIITAAIQFILVAIAYSLAGVKLAFFWAIVTFIFSLIPMIGPAIVYLPLSLSMIVAAIVVGDTVSLVKGIILLGVCLGIVSSVDNVIKPMVISDKVDIHPLVVMVGVVGGLAVFGVVGIMLGPLILVFLITLLNIYEMKEDLTDQMEKSK